MKFLLFQFLFFNFFLKFSKSENVLPFLSTGHNDIDLQEKEFTLIFAFSQHCIYCFEIFQKIIEVIRKDFYHSDQINFYRFDVDIHEDISRFYKITGVPQIIFYERSIGVKEKYDLDIKDLDYFLNIRLKKKFYSVNIFMENNLINLHIKGCPEKNELLFKAAANLFIFKFTELADDKLSCNLEIIMKLEQYYEILDLTLIDDYNTLIDRIGYPKIYDRLNHRIIDEMKKKQLVGVALISHKTLYTEWKLRESFKNSSKELIQFSNQLNISSTIFLSLDPKQTLVRPLLHFVGVSEKELPILICFKFTKNSFVKLKLKVARYIFSNEIYSFLIKPLMNNLVLYHRHQRYRNLRSNFNLDIIFVNNKNLEQFFKYKKNVKDKAVIKVIEFYSPACKHSKTIDRSYRLLAQNKISEKNFLVLFGKANVFDEDLIINGEEIKEIPEIRIYFNQYDYKKVPLFNVYDQISLKNVILKIIEATLKEKLITCPSNTLINNKNEEF